jgi:hypothetical protein
LVNLSDYALEQFYRIPFIREYLAQPGHKHPTLCAKCLEELLGRPQLTFADFKFKRNKWMTSNVAYVITKLNITEEKRQALFEKLKGMDKSGIIDIRFNHQGNRQFIKEFLS